TNQKAIKNLSSIVKKNSIGKIRVFVFSYWNFMKESFDHAGFVETSLILSVSKKVKMKLAKKFLTIENLK
ncbi:MAG: creatininase family protein, partial [Nitrosopumilaceae archaeon]